MRAAFHAFVAATALALCTGTPGAQDLGDCPDRGVSWTTENLKQCVDDFSRQIEQSPPQSQKRAQSLAKRAQANQNLGAHQSEGRKFAGPHFEAALADYAAALAIAPRDDEIRFRRARLLLDMERGEEALVEVEVLIKNTPDSVRFQSLKGWALAGEKRHKEAIEIYTHAIGLAQSCAEAALIQRKINEYRHAFDPPPTREEAMRQIKSMPLYDVPEPGVIALGFPCKPSSVNAFNDLVTLKPSLFEGRAASQRALSNPWPAFKDLKYALSISFVPEFASVQLCDLGLDLQQGAMALEHCRNAFDGNTSSILSDPTLAAKIGQALLEDGDIKGACRIAFPFVFDEGMRDYVAHAEMRALRTRAHAASKAAGFACERSWE